MSGEEQMPRERTEPNGPPPLDQSMHTGAEQAEAVETTTPADLLALVSRIAKMTNKVVQDTAIISQSNAAMSQAMADGFNKLQITFAMLTKQVATNDVKIDTNLIELRRQFSSDISGLSNSLVAETTNRAVERILLTAVADIIDNASFVLESATSTAETSVETMFNALRMMRDTLLSAFEPFGVQQLLVVPGHSEFDENLHTCVALAQPDDPHIVDVPTNVVTDVYKRGYTLHGRVIRRATVVMKGD